MKNKEINPYIKFIRDILLSLYGLLKNTKKSVKVQDNSLIDRLLKRFLDENSILENARDICAVILVVFGLISENNYYSWMFFGVFLTVFLLTSFFTNKNLVINEIIKKPSFYLFFTWPITFFLYKFLGKGQFSIYAFAIAFFYYIYIYYRKLEDYDIIKLIAYSALIYILMMVAVTILMYRSQPIISRELAAGGRNNVNPYSTHLIANFQSVYSLVLLSLAVTGIIRKFIRIFVLSTNEEKEAEKDLKRVERKSGSENLVKSNRHKLLYEICGLGIFQLMIFYLILKSQYSFAIIFTFIFTLVIFIHSRITWKKVLAMIIILGIIAFNLKWLVYFFINLNINGYISSRLEDFAVFLSVGKFTGHSDLINRLSLWGLSIDSFLKYPLVGFPGMAMQEYVMSSGHSTILDNMAHYGIIGITMFLAPILTGIAIVIKSLPSRFKPLYSMIALVYIIEITVNTGYTSHFLVTLFILIPFLFIIADEKIRNFRKDKDLV